MWTTGHAGCVDSNRQQSLENDSSMTGPANAGFAPTATTE